MKKLAIVLGLVASFVVLAGCANKCETCPQQAAAAPVHHDFKGEVGNN